jgi:hypothetical protein
MKKILYLILGAVLVLATSCMKKDNWDEPDARFYGKIIDSYTGENLLTSQGEWGIRIWERSWTESVANSQSLSVKQDGTYNDTKLFGGTYDMLPYGGPFWPCDTVKGVKLGSATEQNFTVTPYLQIANFTATLTGIKLTLKCTIKAPRRDGLPNLVELKPFISLTTFCGAGVNSFIDIPDYNNKRLQYNKSWQSAFGDVDESPIQIIKNLPVKPGYTYYVRLGANVEDASKKYNYSEIVKIVVPSDAVDDPNAVPDNYMKNAEWPFTKDQWDGNRWGTLLNWTANAAMLSRGNGLYGGYDGGWDGPQNDKQSLGFERWGDGENPIVNGKLYQTIDLPAGIFEFTMSLAGNNPIISNNGNDPRYIVVAAGTTLPDIGNLNTAIGSAAFAGLTNDKSVKVSFTLTAPTKVSAGFVVSFTNIEQNVRPSTITLKKMD